MPQLDLSTYISQAFWLLICFCMLWFLLATFVTPKLSDIIEQRKRKIDEYIQKADKLNLQAKDSLNKYNAAFEQAKQQAEQELTQGKTELKAYLNNAEGQLVAKLNQKIADNEFMLAKEKKDTLLQIETIAQDLAFSIVQKLGFSNIKKQEIIEISQREVNNG